MSEKKPQPLVKSPIPKVCPVCGESSYSPGGIHPQCAVMQADAPRRERLAAEKKANQAARKADAHSKSDD